MRTYSGLPQQLIDGWASSNETHPALQRVDFHYHDFEEWLEVLRGEITFFSLSGQRWPLTAGGVLQIPRGEVHRVEIGADGVEYQMYLPIEITTGFANTLSLEEIELLRTSLESPIREDNTDGRAAEFFAAHLSDSLVFCRADGSIVGKEAFRGGFTNKDRSTSGTVCVLNRTAKGILLSTEVTVGAGGPTPKHFTNVRFFAKETDLWKCRIWINFPACDFLP